MPEKLQQPELRMSKAADLVTATLSGIGAGYGYVVWRAVMDTAHWTSSKWVSWLFSFALIALLSWMFVDPFREKVRSSPTSGERLGEPGVRRSWFVLFLPFPVLLSIEFTMFFFHHWATEHLVDTVFDLSAAVLITGAITYQWMAAIRRKPSWPAVRGFVTGLTVTILYVWFRWVINGRELIHSGRYVPMTFAQATMVGLNNGLLFWGLLGLVGGLALVRPRVLTQHLRIAIALVLTVIGTDWLFGISVWADVSKVCGWGAALWIESDRIHARLT